MFSKDKKIEEMLKNIDVKLNHIQDIAADNRVLIVKLVKQGNQIVKFLQTLEVATEEISNVDDFSISPKYSTESNNDLEKLYEQLEGDTEELKEFEEEIKKHIDKIVPGQVGES